MTHLNDEQIETLLNDPRAADEHVDACPDCRQRLDDARAIKARLAGAFAAVQPDAMLEHQVAASLRAAKPARQALPRRLFLNRFASSLAAAAALVALAVGLTLQLAPRQAMAGAAELANIHQDNLLAEHNSHDAPTCPTDVADYLRKELGFVPALPKLGAGMEIRSCCIAHFRNRPVGSYVLNSGKGLVSIIVLKDKADSLGLKDKNDVAGRTYYSGVFGRCHLVSAQADGYAYVVIGCRSDVPWLTELLRDLLG